MARYVRWTDREWDFCLKCIADSYSIDEAVNKFNAHPEYQRTKDQIFNKFYTLEKSPTQFLKTQNRLEDSTNFKVTTIEENLQIQKLKQEMEMVKAELKATRSAVVTDDRLVELIHGLNEEASFDDTPKWLVGKDIGGLTGTPVLFLSDIHFDEVVDSKQIGFVNKYNREVATARLEACFKTTVALCKNYMNKPSYDGCVLMLGGDLLSGNIHEELAETNDARILSSVLTLTSILISGIELLYKEFGKVFIPCVVGNHGRLHKKPRYKYRVQDNYEWLIYQFLAKHFKDVEGVDFLIPDSPDAYFNVYDTKFLLTHGDQFRGGSGISGIFAPLFIGQARKQRNYQAIKKGFDIMAIGHFHQYIHTNSLIVNGSVKGYDEFAYMHNFSFEPAQQAMFIVHPVHGVTYRMPILCGGLE